MAVAEDRRRIGTRLVVLQVGAVVGVRCARHLFLGPADRSAHQVRGDGREQPSADARAAGAARRAVRSQRQGPRRQSQLLHDLDRPRAHQGSRSHGAAARRQWPASIPSRSSRSSIDIAASRRTGRSSSSRTPRSRRSRRSPRAVSTSSCRTSSSMKCRRESIRPTRWRRSCSATWARRARRRSATASSQGDIIGQQGVEKAYNQLLMGEDGAKRVVVNSMGREIRTIDEIAADRRPPRPADDRLRPAEGRGGRVPQRRLQRRRADHGSAQRRGADLHQPAVVRPERLCRRASIA